MLASSLARCLPLLAAMFLAACTPTRIEHPVTAVEREATVHGAVKDIVLTRCDLEQHCSNVGPGQKYETPDSCVSKLQGTTASELNTNDCPLGVDPHKLDVCLANIRAQECGSVFDSLSRWNACRNGQLCYSK